MNASVPADLQRFAAEAVAEGRFSNVAEVVTAGLRLLQRAEAQRADFIASLDAAINEGERDGFLTLEQVEQEMDELLASIARA